MKDRICLYTPPFTWINSYRQFIDTAAECGLSAIECLNLFEFTTPDPEAARQIKAYADSKGIRIVCFSVFIDLTGEDAEEKLLQLKGYAQVAAILGSPYLHHTICPEYNTPNPQMFETFFERGVAAVRESYDYAGSLGVKTVYEDQGYVFNGVQGFDRFLREVDRNVGVVMDMGNIYQVDESPEAFVAAFAHRAEHAHIKDVAYSQNKEADWYQTLKGNFFACKCPGEGIVDLQKCITLLEKTGYTGYYGLEFAIDSGDVQELKNYIDQAASWLKGI